MVYEVINPSDACTVESDSPLCAWLAMLLVSNGAYGLTGEDDERLPFAPFGLTPEGVERILREHFACELSMAEAMDANLDGIAACLESFVYGSRRDRVLFGAATEAITDESKRKEFAARWADEKRTSMANIGKACADWAETVRKKAASAGMAGG